MDDLVWLSEREKYIVEIRLLREENATLRRLLVEAVGLASKIVRHLPRPNTHALRCQCPHCQIIKKAEKLTRPEIKALLEEKV